MLCDGQGPFASPNSDSVRTMVTADCRDTLIVVYGFGAAGDLDGALDVAEDALQRYCDGTIRARWRVEP